MITRLVRNKVNLLLAALCGLVLFSAVPARAQLSLALAECTIATTDSGAITCAHGNASTPVAAIWFGTGLGVGNTSGSSLPFMLGFSVSSTEECVTSGWVTDGAATTNAGAAVFDNASLVAASAPTTTDMVVDFTSFDATNINLNVSDAPGAVNRTFQVLTIAGTGLDVDVGVETVSSGTGSQAFSSITSFQGKLIMFARGRLVTGANNAFGADMTLSVGAATSSSSQWTYAFTDDNNVGATDSATYWDDDNALSHPTPTATVGGSFALTSLDATGYTINKTDDFSGNTGICRMIIGGTNFSAVVGTNAAVTTTPATQTINTLGAGHTPEAALFVLGSATTEDTATDHLQWSFGAAAGVAAQRVAAVSSTHAADPSETARAAATGKAMRSISGASGTTQTEADVDSFSDGEMVLDWTTVDATARRYGYITMENSAVAAASGSCFGTLLGVGC